MTYASYEQYRTLYQGESLTEEQFGLYAQRAGEYLELLTYGRCGDVLGEQEALLVAKACCALAEELCRQASGPQVTGHTVGQWSRSYAPEPSRERRLADAARTHLRGTGLLWRGFVRKQIF